MKHWKSNKIWILKRDRRQRLRVSDKNYYLYSCLRSDDILYNYLLYWFIKTAQQTSILRIQWNMLIRQQMKTIRMTSERKTFDCMKIIYKKKIKFLYLIWFFNIFIKTYSKSFLKFLFRLYFLHIFFKCCLYYNSEKSNHNKRVWEVSIHQCQIRNTVSSSVKFW